MEQTTIEIDLTPLVTEFVALAVNLLAAFVVLSVVLYVVVGIPLILYVSNALERRLTTPD